MLAFDLSTGKVIDERTGRVYKLQLIDQWSAEINILNAIIDEHPMSTSNE